MSRAVRNVSVISKPDNSKKYTIIIPAAGEGTRMITYGVKPLIQINNKTIIQRQLNAIDEVFVHYEVILVGGFQANRLFKNTPEDIIKVENPDFKNTNVLYSIGLALQETTSNRVVIIYGDLVFNKRTIMGPFDNESTLILDRAGYMGENEVGCTALDSEAVHICYGLPKKWAQVCYLTGTELDMFRNFATDKQNRKLYGFECLNYIMSSGGTLRTYEPKYMKVTDVDTSKDIKIAENML